MFNSTFRKIWNHSPLEFPEFSGTRVMMMPVNLGSVVGVPVGPWFEGYTKNPAGIMPSNDILPKRTKFMEGEL